MSRTKGAVGEREFINLICEMQGIDRTLIERNSRQTFSGGHDVLGMEPFAVECKRYKTTTIPQRQQWWSQAVEQARVALLVPALAYRADRQPEWRVVIPLHIINPQRGSCRRLHDWEYTVDLHPLTFSRMLSLVIEREIMQ